MNKFITSTAICAAAALGFAAQAAKADTIGTPTAFSPAPAYYNGTDGNPQGNFNLTTSSSLDLNPINVEVGLRARVYQGQDLPVDASGGTTTYYAAAGVNGTHATWNYDFSVAITGGDLSDITSGNILITDITTGVTNGVGYNPFTLTDDSSVSGGGAVTHNSGTAPSLSDSGIQNSENLVFGDTGLGVLFDPNANDLYQISFTGTFIDGGSFSNTIDVQVPEPVSMTLLGTGLIGLAAARRKRRA